MALEQMLAEPVLTLEQTTLRSRFFDQSGYGPSDLLSLNYSTGIFLTRNGGKYRVSGDALEWLAGPSPSVEERDQWEL
jgi:hypothetical protein